MSVIAFNRLADQDAGLQIDGEGARTYPAVHFECITDNIADGESLIHAYVETPRLYVTAHPEDSQALCTGLRVYRQDAANDYWRVVASYSTKLPFLAQATKADGDFKPPSTELSPLLQRPKVSFSFRYFKEIREVDEDNIPYRNSSWEPYPPEVVEVPRTVVHVSRNVSSVDPRILADCEGACNSLTFQTYQPDFIKCMNLRAEPMHDRQWGSYFVQSGDFVIGNTSTDWHTNKLDAGFLKWENPFDDDFAEALGMADYSEASPILIRGQRPARPVPLDGTGQVLPPNVPPVYNRFRFFRRADLNRLLFFL